MNIPRHAKSNSHCIETAAPQNQNTNKQFSFNFTN